MCHAAKNQDVLAFFGSVNEPSFPHMSLKSRFMLNAGKDIMCS
jgi:hypothetical protein